MLRIPYDLFQNIDFASRKVQNQFKDKLDDRIIKRVIFLLVFQKKCLNITDEKLIIVTNVCLKREPSCALDCITKIPIELEKYAIAYMEDRVRPDNEKLSPILFQDIGTGRRAHLRCESNNKYKRR